MNQLNLKACSNNELFNALKSLRSTECEVIAEIVRYLAEVDQRQVYRDYGYSSLFMFCVAGLGYSEGAAQRRIVAARSLNQRPEVYQLLQEGELSLCALAEVARVITPENGAEVLQSAQGLGKQEAQRLAAQYQPAVKPTRETVRARKVVVQKPSLPSAEAKFTSPVAVIEERFSLSFEISARGKELLEDAKRYSGKVKVGELFELLLEDYVSRKRPKAAAVEKVEKPVPEAQVGDRPIDSLSLAQGPFTSRSEKPLAMSERMARVEWSERDLPSSVFARGVTARLAEVFRHTPIFRSAGAALAARH